jgi:hypothetical protein
MLSKSHDASARIADKRMALAFGAAVAGLLGVLVFAGQAGADVPVAGVLGSVTTRPTQAVASTGQSVTNVAAPSSKDLPQAAVSVVAPATKVVTQRVSSTTQAAGDVVAPAVRTATQSAGSVVAPATKVVTQGVSSTTQAAGDVVAPAVRTATQSAGSVVAPATKVVTQGVSSTTQAAGDVVAPAVRTATQGAGDVVAPATKVVTQGVSSTTQAAGAGTRAAPETLAPALSDPSSSPPLSAAPPSLGVEEPQLPLGGGQSSKGVGGPTILPGSHSIPSVGVASMAFAPLGALVAHPASGAGHNGSPPASIPSSPGPSPGGVSESTVAACGVALSIFLTLASLAMLVAPRAMCRLRDASEPWRLAPFVLIPERPG